MRVLGIDPGLTTTGFGVVERSGGRLRACGAGAIRTATTLAVADRLLALRDGLAEVFERHSPDTVALERVFFNANVRTAMAVGQASGVALLAAAQAGLEVATYTPTEVKLSVVGVGNATKKQVQAMVTALLGLETVPEPPDAADAYALAICHLNRSRFSAALDRAGGGARR